VAASVMWPMLQASQGGAAVALASGEPSHLASTPGHQPACKEGRMWQQPTHVAAAVIWPMLQASQGGIECEHDAMWYNLVH
jgi:hypothetical protein